MLISWLITSIITAIGIMLSSEIIEHNLEFKHAILMALAANLLPYILYIEYLNIQIGSVILTTHLLRTLLYLIGWVVIALIIMRDTSVGNRIKIAILGFVITQILLFILPWFGVI